MHLYFTLSAGRTGTKFLASLFKQNSPFPELPIHHDQFHIDNFGIQIPDLSHMLMFNNQGNVAHVQSFWDQKINRILSEGNESGYYVETSHRAFKAGLIENLARRLDPEKHTVHLIDLRRDVLPTLLSYQVRFDFTTYENRWIWYLDPSYKKNLLDFTSYQQLPLDQVMQMRLWYLHEIQTRAQYYRFKYRQHPLFVFHRQNIEQLNFAATVQQFFTDLDWPAKKATPTIPSPQNTTIPEIRSSVTQYQKDELLHVINRVNFSPKILAREILKRQSKNSSSYGSWYSQSKQAPKTLTEDWKNWLTGSYTSEANPIFIGGSPRSGTTLLRVMLDTHQELCCGPESHLLSALPKADFKSQVLAKLAVNFNMSESEVYKLYNTSDSLAQFIDSFFAKYAQQEGATRWVEKTPKNVQQIPFIFEHFPNSNFIHVIRDGRDVSTSLQHFPRHKVVNGELVENKVTNPINACAKHWVKFVRKGLKFRDDPRYMEVRYEELVEDPENTLRNLCDKLNLEFDPHMLEYHKVDSSSRDYTRFPENPEAVQPLYKTSKQRWVDDLTDSQLQTIYREAGDLLQELDYWDGKT